jgi:serine/threonine protein kinase
MAPEVLSDVPINNEKSDVWAFGISAYELAYAETPWSYEDDDKEVMKEILSLFDQHIPSPEFPITQCTPVDELITVCCTVGYRQRPSARQLLRDKPGVLNLAASTATTNAVTAPAAPAAPAAPVAPNITQPTFIYSFLQSHK